MNDQEKKEEFRLMTNYQYQGDKPILIDVEKERMKRERYERELAEIMQDLRNIAEERRCDKCKK